MWQSAVHAMGRSIYERNADPPNRLDPKLGIPNPLYMRRSLQYVLICLKQVSARYKISYAMKLKSPSPVRRPTTRIAAKNLCNINVDIQGVVTPL